MQGSGPAIIQLMAELMWFMRLFPIGKQLEVTHTTILASTKRENVERILSWGNLSMPDSPLLSNHTLLGLGKPSPQYIMNSPDMAMFLVNFLSNWKSLLRDKRENFLEAAEAFNFASYLDQFLTNDLYKSDKALPVRHDLFIFFFQIILNVPSAHPAKSRY